MKKKYNKIQRIGRVITQISKELYFIFSVDVLKRRFGIENATYLNWHNKRAYRTQVLLDMEHGTNISGAY